jgi:hypothetical protein
MAAATARVVVLMAPDEKEEIAKRAAHDGISIGEFVRRPVWGTITDDMLEAELEACRDELEPVLEELERCNAESLSAIARVDALGRAVDQVDRRLVRVETVLEFATHGRFRPRLIRPGGEPGER